MKVTCVSPPFFHHTTMTGLKIFKGFLILLAMVVFLILSGKSRSNTPGEASTERVKWASLIEKRGGAVAYEEFKQEYLSFPLPEQHAMMHLFGEVLYDTLGDEG